MKNKLIISLFALGMTVFAETKVSSIEITNLKELPKDVVEEVMPVKVGSNYSNRTANDIYTSLLRTGLVTDVKITQNKNGDNVDLKLEVKEVPNAKTILAQMEEIKRLQQKTDFVIKSIKIQGTNKNLNEILLNSPLKEGSLFVPYNSVLLEQLLLSTGVFSKVETILTRDAENKTVDIKVNVTENPIIKSIKIEGSTLFNENELIAASGLKIGETLNTRLLSLDESIILRAYRENGYLWVGFNELIVTENGDVYININEGKVTDVVFEKKGASKSNEKASKKEYVIKTKDFVLNRNTYIQKGKPLNEKELTTTLTELFRTGLFQSLEHQVVPVSNKPGDYIVKIIVTERPTTAINANISYSTEESLSGALKLSDSNFLGREQIIDITGEAGIRGNYSVSINFKDPWIKGTDRLLVGGSIFFRRTKSRLKDIDGYNDLNKESQKKVSDNVYFSSTDKEYTYGITGQIGKGFGKNFYVTATPKILSVYAKNLTPEDKFKVYKNYSLASLGIDLIYDTRDDRVIPKKGFFADLYVEGGYIFRDKSLLYKERETNEQVKNTDKNGKDLELVDNKGNKYNKKINLGPVPSGQTLKPRGYYTTTLDLRAYHKVYKERNSMAYRLLSSYSQENTPSSQLMTIGDGVTLRGQRVPQSIQYGVVFTAENRTYINDYLQGVIFYEAGYYKNPEQKPNEPKHKFAHDFGLGARINTPIGLLRLDYAWDLDFKAKDGRKIKGKFNFGFGHTF